jgi:hypothetical protein
MADNAFAGLSAPPPSPRPGDVEQQGAALMFPNLTGV